MSKIGVTTQDLFQRIGSTSISRSVRADAVFRRLRVEEQQALAKRMLRAPQTEPLILDDQDRVEDKSA